MEALYEILRASLFLGEVRDDYEVFRKLLAFHLEQFPKLFA